MSTLQTQYQNYLKENPESTFTFEEWSNWKFSNMELPPPHNGLRPLDEYACSLGGGDDIVSHLFNSKDWDVTLMDGLENEPYISDDFQIGPDGAYEHIEEWNTLPREKASELIVNYQTTFTFLDYNEAKQCALVLVDEIKRVLYDQDLMIHYDYWFEVKKEIEKL
jgi:hypothetical protein